MRKSNKSHKRECPRTKMLQTCFTNCPYIPTREMYGINVYPVCVNCQNICQSCKKVWSELHITDEATSELKITN